MTLCSMANGTKDYMGTSPFRGKRSTGFYLADELDRDDKHQ